jgi:integrase
MHADGRGLYLLVGRRGTKSWIYRYRQDGRLHDMGLGSAADVSLARARQKARACREQRADGIDPLEAKRAGQQRRRLEAARAMTFRQCAEGYIAANKIGWKNAKHAAQWPSSLAAYVYPVFGDLPVQAIDVGLVMKALEPVWQKKSETASRVRMRIEAVIDWATARKYRQGDNPARWRGHLDQLLPPPGKVRKVEHHAALPYAEIGAFVTALRAQEGIAARALEFAILTAGRTGEVIGARWDEIDLAERLWVVPGERTKAGKEHRVPLCDAALALIDELHKSRQGDVVFRPVRPADQQHGDGDDAAADGPRRSHRPRVFARHSRIGPPTAPAFPARSSRWRSPIPFPTRSRRLTGAALRWRSDGS